MSSFSNARVVAIWAAVVILAGCGSSGGTSATSGSSPSPTDATSPSAPTVDLEGTAPQGTYKVRTKLIRTVPRVTGFWKSESLTWTFYPPSCDGTHCTGKTKSSHGAIYSYEWDGATLRMKRVSDPGSGQGTCRDGGPGRFNYVYLQTLSDLLPAETPTNAPPTLLNGQTHWTVTYSKVKNCPMKARYGSSVDFNVTLTKKG